MLAKLLALIGLAAPHLPDEGAMYRELRRARAAGWKHGRLNSHAQSASLDRIEGHVSDPVPAEIKAEVKRVRRNLDAIDDAFRKRRS